MSYVYAVIGHYDYEGSDCPVIIATNYQYAYDILQKVKKRYDSTSIVRYQLGIPVEEPNIVFTSNKTMMEYVGEWDVPAKTTVGDINGN